MSGTIRYEILGPMQVLRGGEELPLGGRQRRRALARLISADGRTVSMSELIDAVWPEDPPATARNSVQQYIHHVRAQIGDALQTGSTGYTLETGGNVDAPEFESALDQARDLPPAERAAALGAALEL